MTAQSPEDARHDGSLISGQVTCSCGWKSEHYALASDAIDDFDQHLREESLPMPKCSCAMTEASQRTCPMHGEDQWLDPRIGDAKDGA